MNRVLSELLRRNVLRVAAAYLIVGWLIMQVVSVMTPALNLPEWVDGFFAVLLIAGFPLALLLAWAFELTPEGVRLTAAADGSEAPRALINTDFAIIGLLIVVLGVAGYQILTRTPASTADAEATPAAPSVPAAAVFTDASIAVLPFADLSPDSDQAYFSDGMAEEILNLLVRIDELDVTSRTSAFQYRGDAYSIPQIAAALNVRHIVEGSVRKDGDTVRITAQLIDARDDRHLWSATFDRPLTAGALFAVQDEISAAIVAALSEALNITVTAPLAAPVLTDDIGAYDAYLQARALSQARYRLDDAEDLLEHAVTSDPDFAAAWALRAAVTMLSQNYGYSQISIAEVHRLSLEYADRALTIDPRSAMALAVRAKIRALNNETFVEPINDWAEIIADFDAALAIDPLNLEALNWRGQAMEVLGRTAEARPNFLRCMTADPFYAPCHLNYCIQLTQARDDMAALACHRDGLARGLIRMPGFFLGLFARTGEERAFMMAASHPTVLPGWNRYDDLYQAFRSPDADHSALLASVHKHFEQLPDYFNTVDISITVPLGGEADEGWPMWGPDYAEYRRSASFIEFIERAGILAYWQTHGFPPRCRPVPATNGGADGFECG
jgi:TolB-like protein